MMRVEDRTRAEKAFDDLQELRKNEFLLTEFLKDFKIYHIKKMPRDKIITELKAIEFTKILMRNFKIRK